MWYKTDILDSQILSMNWETEGNRVYIYIHTYTYIHIYIYTYIHIYIPLKILVQQINRCQQFDSFNP